MNFIVRNPGAYPPCEFHEEQGRRFRRAVTFPIASKRPAPTGFCISEATIPVLQFGPWRQNGQFRIRALPMSAHPSFAGAHQGPTQSSALSFKGNRQQADFADPWPQSGQENAADALAMVTGNHQHELGIVDIGGHLGNGNPWPAQQVGDACPPFRISGATVVGVVDQAGNEFSLLPQCRGDFDRAHGTQVSAFRSP